MVQSRIVVRQSHRFHARHLYDARVEVTDSLGHVTVAHVAVDLRS